MVKMAVIMVKMAMIVLFVYSYISKHGWQYTMQKMTNVSYIFTLGWQIFRIFSPWLLLLYWSTYIFCSFIPNIVEARLIQRFTSFVQRPSSVIRPPWYTISVTSSSVSPSIFIYNVFRCFPIDLDIVLVFSTLILSPNLWLLLYTLSVSYIAAVVSSCSCFQLLQLCHQSLMWAKCLQSSIARKWKKSN